ncbi:MAG: hypothetical protein U9R16_02980 [Campylobacterota bacterium]|nr:hypothetical protein [Campylobacterota bacterium]
MKNIYLVLVIALFISGCSSRQYFEPEDTNGDYQSEVSYNDYEIVDFNANGATLEDYKFISADGITTNSIKNGFKFINNNDGVIIGADSQGQLLIQNKGSIEEFAFDKNIISASVKDNLIALCFVDNSIMLYDKKLKQKYFKEYFTLSLVNDIKIANPIFLDTVILYPTLDGKVIVVDIAKKSIIKTMNIDPRGKINNIIYLSSIDDTLVAATPSKLFTFVSGRVNIKDFDIKNVIINNKSIIISTLDGEVIKLNKELQIIKRKKFKFAKFHALGAGEYIYALESNEYLIRFNSDLEDVKIFDFSFDEDKKVISIGDKLYFDDKSITLK